MVEIRETVKEIVVPVYMQTEIAAEPQLGAEEKFIFAAHQARERESMVIYFQI